jgi:hypothetical protein
MTEIEVCVQDYMFIQQINWYHCQVYFEWVLSESPGSIDIAADSQIKIQTVKLKLLSI